MLKFSFSTEPLEEEPSEFDLGDLCFSGPEFKLSSREAGAAHSMMIFIALSDLLFGVAGLLVSAGEKKFLFVGADSSFSFSLVKLSKGRIALFHKGKEIAVMNNEDLILALWNGAQEFLESYLTRLPDGPVKRDLELSCNRYKEAFGEVISSSNSI